MSKHVYLLAGLLFLFVNLKGQEWILHKDKDNSFQIEFPGEPNNIGTDTKSSGVTSFISAISLDLRDSVAGTTTFLIMCYRIQETADTESRNEKAESFFNLWTTIFVGESNFRAVSEEAISLDGFKGKYIKGEGAIKPGVALFQFFLVKDRIYNLVVAFPKEKQNYEYADRFFSSFKILGK